MRIVELRVNNFLGVEAVEIIPGEGPVILGGRNGAGKSSVLEAIRAAFEGQRERPAQPIRHGAESGEVLCDLGDVRIRRAFKGGEETLIVEGSNGARFQRPQAMLDSLYGKIAFDPLLFAKSKSAEQARIVTELSGLDLSDLDGKRATAYEARRDVGREVARLEGAVKSAQHYPDAPEEAVNVWALTEALTAAEGSQRAVSERLRTMDRYSHEIGNIQAEIQALEEQIAKARKRSKDGEAALEEARHLYAAALAAAVDPTPIRAELEQADSINAKVRANEAREALETALDFARATHADHDAAIRACDAEREARIKAAAMPLPGLTLGDDGALLYHGVPLSQASQAEQIRVSVAVGAALKPKLAIAIVQDGALLDSESLALLCEACAAAGVQPWIERVGDGEECTVVIEAGRVREVTV